MMTLLRANAKKTEAQRFAVKLAVGAQPDRARKNQRGENSFCDSVESHSHSVSSYGPVRDSVLKLVAAPNALCDHVRRAECRDSASGVCPISKWIEGNHLRRRIRQSKFGMGSKPAFRQDDQCDALLSAEPSTIATPVGGRKRNISSGSGRSSCQSPNRYSSSIPPACRICAWASSPLDESTSSRTSVKFPVPGSSVESFDEEGPAADPPFFSPLGKQRRIAWPAGVALWLTRSMRLHSRERSAFPVSRASGVRQSELSFTGDSCDRVIGRNIKPDCLSVRDKELLFR